MRFKTVRVLAFALLLAPAALWAQQKTPFHSLQEALMAGGQMSGAGGPRNVVWIEGGRRYSFTTRGANGEEIRAMDPATGHDTLLFSAQGLTFPGTSEAFAYRSFDWARDFRHLVFQTHFRPLYRRSGTSDFYVYTLANRSLQLAARGARTGELSPDGAMLGYERDGDMYVYDLARNQERRLTSDATETVYNGHFDWVYEEEFGMAQAWNWSPDSHYVAFWQLDEHTEPVIQISDLSGAHPTWERIRIPQPGDSNATARIGVSDVRTGQKVWLDPGETGEFYIPRIYWTSRADTLAVITLNRLQNTMKLYFFDVRTGGKRLVMTESNSAWIDVYDFYGGVQDLMSFPDGATQFFWISDRDGWQHIYRYDYSGRLLNQVTRGNWSVTRIEGIDARGQTIYYSSTQASPLQRQLYSVRFDGTNPRRITQTQGTHGINMSPDAKFFIDSWSSTRQPRQVETWATTATGGQMLRKMEDNAAVTQWVASHAYAPTELASFTTSDGQRLDFSMVRPPDFDSTRRYPVVFTIYGGPGSQAVYDRWGGSGFQQWLAQEGFILVDVNNRPSNNYGSAFMKGAYRHLGTWEAHDFAETARYLQHMPWVDSAHVGIMGTSYGGYTTLYTMATYPDIFSVGVANSAVTDHRLYDTIYTERYMGLLPDNAAGYDSASVLLRAGRIRGHLLVIHSLRDDNVHPQHTMQFLTALANAGVDADLRIYPPGRHGAAYNGQSAMLIQRNSDAWLNRWLKGTESH
ncbi:MAG: DPP IV N-terminal domain-containing protein [Gemmatimonadales bacterium]|jgi:dipeptidyl-peptidase-4